MRDIAITFAAVFDLESHDRGHLSDGQDGGRSEE